MPVRLRNRDIRSARVATTLAGVTSTFTGTFAQATGRTGTIATVLGNVTSLVVGQVQANPNYTGTLATTLAGMTASVRGTFTAPATLVSPTGLASAFVSATSVSFTWNANPPTGLANYKLWRSTDGTNYTLRATLGPAVLTTTDAVTAGTAYWWYLTAGNGTTDSAQSNIVRSPVGWLTIPAASVNSYPATISNVRQYLVDPAALVTSIELLPPVSAVSAVVQLFDAQNNSIGYGPSAMHGGVFFGVSGLANGDMWWIKTQPTTGATVTALVGGDFTATGVSGTYSFTWERMTGLTGALTTGTKSFTM